jgi:hypothetical protein
LLFALGFVLRGVDVMDHDMFDAIQKWTIAAIISIIDYFYVPLRTALGPRFAGTAGKVGTDFRWWIGAVFIVLLWSVISPIAEKYGWPSQVSINAQPKGEDIAKATALIQSKLDEMTRQRNAAQAEAAQLRQQIAVPLPQQPSLSIQGPINWQPDLSLVASGGGPSTQIHSVLFQGTSTTLIEIKEAYAVSGLTGHKQELMANVQYRGYYLSPR